MIIPTDTVYPVLKDNMNLKELDSCFLATEEEIKFIDDETRQESAKLGFLITLKTFQILGYFVPTKTVPLILCSLINAVESQLLILILIQNQGLILF